MVNSSPGLTDQPRVMNGFSDLMVEVFGEPIDKHEVGLAELPAGTRVEIEMILETAVSACAAPLRKAIVVSAQTQDFTLSHARERPPDVHNRGPGIGPQQF